jgi:hypothetical protein
MIMSANVGVALMLVSRPATFTDESVSRRVRDAVHATVFTPDVTAATARGGGGLPNRPSPTSPPRPPT